MTAKLLNTLSLPNEVEEVILSRGMLEHSTNKKDVDSTDVGDILDMNYSLNNYATFECSKFLTYQRLGTACDKLSN